MQIELEIPEDLSIIIGVALCYSYPQHPRNQYRLLEGLLQEVVHFKVQTRSIRINVTGSLSDAKQFLIDKVNRYRNFFRAILIISFIGHSETCPWCRYIL